VVIAPFSAKFLALMPSDIGIVTYICAARRKELPPHLPNSESVDLPLDPESIDIPIESDRYGSL
jgi:hypothetical protein